ncbi:hypothetical protein PISMIDRAFT_19722 [Pisolithus microcarpus 441]|uniref:Unplaced genomic scaffold scaffold_590, whole genome shotgun sequence n=1 Tax=Pisolithus microcarpus 441 TaxID=765257 RepID=A0A0C9Y1Z3_9AGAM|nr:hypothetical protein BKA83DRAFT_19722 [Pisolithus microcarpus]KIK11216.1 hypothetical protein PISMIDRAFT_19722 [Pisolithus microcarpus 441]
MSCMVLLFSFLDLGRIVVMPDRERLKTFKTGTSSFLPYSPSLVPYNPQVRAMLAYVDALHEEIVLPDLSTVMDSRTQPFFVSLKTMVRNVAKLMKEHHVTAICVMENSPAPEIEVD